MVRTSRLAGIALAGALVLGGLTASSAVASASTPCGGTGSVTTVPGTLSDGATYLLECPAGPWNGTLLLYSHGYVAPGAAAGRAGRRDRRTRGQPAEHQGSGERDPG